MVLYLEPAESSCSLSPGDLGRGRNQLVCSCEEADELGSKVGEGGGRSSYKKGGGSLLASYSEWRGRGGRNGKAAKERIGEHTQRTFTFFWSSAHTGVP